MNEPCDKCDGKGKFSFESGRYESRCMDCRGTGRKNWKRHACKKCKGYGYMDGTCTECYGSGLK